MKTTKFKMTEIGPIPEDWEVKRLGEIFELSAAGDLQFECSSREKTDLNIYPIYSNSIENAGLYGFTSNPRYSADSITITGRGTLGHAEYRAVDFDAIIRLIIMKPLRVVDGRYVTFQINYCGPFHFEITSIPQLTVPQVANSLIPVPPFHEQKAIAEALSDVDELLTAMTTLIEKKRAIKQGAMQELLTGKKRLPGFSGDWVEKRLGECSDIRTGKRNGNEQSLEGKYPFFVRSQEVARINTYSYDGEAILVPGEGGIGSIFHYINGRFDYHQRVYKISDFKNNCVAKYIYYYLKRYFGEWSLSQTVKATVDSLRLPTFENFIINAPSTIAEQQAIAEVLSAMDDEITALETKKTKYESIKQSMMQELLTGRMRMKD